MLFLSCSCPRWIRRIYALPRLPPFQAQRCASIASPVTA